MALIVHSRDRLQGTSDNFTIRCASLVEPGTYSVAYASIPVAVHNVRKNYNDLFSWSVGGTMHTVQFKAGHYTVLSLAQEITKLTSLSCEFDDQSGRLTISHTTPFVIHADTSAEVTGFASTTAEGPSHSGAGVVNLSVPSAFLVQIEEASVGAVTTKGSHCAFLVPIHTNSLEQSEYKSGDWPQAVAFSKPARELRIRLTDTDHRQLQMFGAEWFFLLRKTC